MPAIPFQQWALYTIMCALTINQLQAQPVTYIPAEYDTIREEVEIAPGYYQLIEHPAVLDTIMQEVTIRESSRILRENWRVTYQFTKKADADSIPGMWVGVRDTNCIAANPDDCVYQIWVPESPEYDVRTFKTYLGAVWDEATIDALVVQVPKIVEVRAARVERVWMPPKYKTIEKYVLRKRARRIIRE